jgi:hypothetical protein
LIPVNNRQNQLGGRLPQVVAFASDNRSFPSAAGAMLQIG